MGLLWAIVHLFPSTFVYILAKWLLKACRFKKKNIWNISRSSLQPTHGLISYIATLKYFCRFELSHVHHWSDSLVTIILILLRYKDAQNQIKAYYKVKIYIYAGWQKANVHWHWVPFYSDTDSTLKLPVCKVISPWFSFIFNINTL